MSQPSTTDLSNQHVYTEEEKRRQNRKRLADTFRQNGFIEAGDAVQADQDDMSGYDAVMYSKAIRQAIKDGGAQKWEKMAWAIYYQLKEIANRESEDTALAFLMPLIRVFRSLSLTSSRPTSNMLSAAEKVLENTRPAEEWAPWAISSIDRLIFSRKSNPINELLAEEERFAHNQAEGLIEAIISETRGLVTYHRDQFNRKKLADETARRSRQLQRAAYVQAMKGPGGQKPGHGKGKLGKRRAGDPNRKGK